MLVTSSKQLQILRDNGKIHQEVFDVVRQNFLNPGNTGMEIERAATEILRKYQSQSAFRWAYSYPANTIVSLNETVVHGVPTDQPFEEGDVVTIDFGVKREKLLTDAAFTVIIWKPKDPDHQRMIDVSREALALGIAQAITGNTTWDVGSAIWEHVTGAGFHIVKELTWHGLGTSIHEKPNVYNYGQPGRWSVFGDGQYVAIEPIVGLTTWEIYEAENFAIKMKDHNIGVQEEHCGVITKEGFEIIV